MRVAICGGGTAGHVLPGLALADELKARAPEAEILFVGSSRGVETRLIPPRGYRLELLPSRGLERKISLAAAGVAWAFVVSLWRSLVLLRRFRPRVVVGVGGFASLAPVLAGRALGARVLLHEQNAVPGLANRLLGRLAHRVAVSFDHSEGFFRAGGRVRVTGNPVRAQLLEPIPRAVAARELGLDPGLPTVLVFGGSRGARRINQAVIEALSMLRGLDLQVLHICGPAEEESVQEALRGEGHGDGQLHYQLLPYLDRMEMGFAAADLVVSRAGATSLAEITVLGLPALLVPYPYATASHQEANASVLERAGAAEIIENEELNGSRLGAAIVRLLGDAAKREAMAAAARQLGRPRAAAELADFVEELEKG